MLTREQRNYDAWVTREPYWYNDPEETWQLQHHCSVCGGWLKLKPERTEEWEDGFDCDGRVDTEFGIAACGNNHPHDPHYVIQAAGDTEFRTCSKCGVENKEVVM